MHVHVGFADSLKIFAVVITLGFFWRVAAAKYKDTPAGKAMAFIY